MLQDKLKNTHTIAFYNVENLFDIIDDSMINDDEYTPEGKKQWNKRRYINKLKKLSMVISQLGTNVSTHPPVLIGLTEVENSKVVEDLINHKNLDKYNYDFVHYDSPDERGIDVSLVYDKNFFEFISSETFSLNLEFIKGKSDFTRDVLLVVGRLNGELTHILVCHWPSRREGLELTELNRIEAAKLVQSIISKIKNTINDPKIIIMGDFNDNPTDTSISKYLVTESFFNPMEKLFKLGIGSSSYRGKWNLFDQIILSKSFFNENSKHVFLDARVFNKSWLTIQKGKLKGTPFRTYIGPWYKGGISDHFPVYALLKNEKE